MTQNPDPSVWEFWIDVGGTFTDLVIHDPRDGRAVIWKESTTPDDPARGAIEGTRKVLAKERVFNDKNDIAPGTWGDLFDGRFFSSYIFKESNVQDIRLTDIYKGEDDGVKLLLESERIKNKLLDFEHDLWVY